MESTQWLSPKNTPARRKMIYIRIQGSPNGSRQVKNPIIIYVLVSWVYRFCSLIFTNFSNILMAEINFQISNVALKKNIIFGDPYIYTTQFYCTRIHYNNNNNNYCYIIFIIIVLTYLDPCLWAVSNSRPVWRNPRSIQRTWMHPPREIPRFQGSQHTWSYRNLRRCRTSVLENGSIQTRAKRYYYILYYIVAKVFRTIADLAPLPTKKPLSMSVLNILSYYYYNIVIAIALKSNKH